MSKKSKLPDENATVVELSKEEIEARELKRQEEAKQKLLEQCVQCPTHGLTTPAEFRFVEEDSTITLYGKYCFKCYAEFFEKNGLKNYNGQN